ncbi:MAG: hypothetical protein Q4A01_11715 [Coriobacteriales bacterium]|nr:hypothetical protein [Coriobacteriales bacterium]
MPAMAQLNVRMEPQLKAAGDEVLARLGITPTQFVRALWMKVSRGAEAFDQIVDALAQEPAAVGVGGLVKQIEAEDDPFENRLTAFYQEYGFDYTSYVSPQDDEYEELLMQDWTEREGERMVGYVQ